MARTGICFVSFLNGGRLIAVPIKGITVHFGFVIE